MKLTIKMQNFTLKVKRENLTELVESIHEAMTMSAYRQMYTFDRVINIAEILPNGDFLVNTTMFTFDYESSIRIFKEIVKVKNELSKSES